MSVDSLQLLTSGQALFDLAQFRQYIAASGPAVQDGASAPPLQLPFSAASKRWVVFGGSYPGTLAAWFKLKFPSLAVGAIASSAVVRLSVLVCHAPVLS